MRKKQKNVLGIDWGSKYIWLAYINKWANDLIMPIWYIPNDWSSMFSLWDIISRYNIGKIVIGYPKDDKVREKVDNFINELKFIIQDDIELILQDEEYSSVEAGAMVENFKKNEMEDTLAAMKILERYLNDN